VQSSTLHRMLLQRPYREGSATETQSGALHYGLKVALLLLMSAASAAAQTVIKGGVLHTMGPAGTIRNGVVVIQGGRITAVGPAAEVAIPEGATVLTAEVVTPGLIDAHCVVGLSGIYNQPHDSDQIERSGPIQPELRALDAYNPQERLVEWVRSYGVTTIHTGHAWGELISGQTIIVKTAGRTVEEALLRAPGAVAATLSPWAQKSDGKSPGTRGKMMALLRAELIRAREYGRKQQADDPNQRPERSLRLDVLNRVLAGEVPLMITANRAQDIVSALRLAREFELNVWLDSAAEAYLLVDEIRAAGVPVIVHPTMFRAWGETENLSYETAAVLKRAGIPIALQSGYESYVPKTRVVLFEAALAAANGLSFEDALASITIDAARILGIAERVGSLEVGKDGDAALYDGDPFEYTTHCTGVVINGQPVSQGQR
jgi:imidazolonepropionase-like amidohydrolase